MHTGISVDGEIAHPAAYRNVSSVNYERGSMTSAEVVLAFVKAINRRDVEMLCRLMTDDHLFVDTGGAQYRSRETMR